MDMPTARINDMWLGVCTCHPPIPIIGMAGIIVTSSPNVFSNNLGNARCTDTVIGFCGHSGVVISCSTSVFTNNLGQAKNGDNVNGCVIGNISSGSPNVNNL